MLIGTQKILRTLPIVFVVPGANITIGRINVL